MQRMKGRLEQKEGDWKKEQRIVIAVANGIKRWEVEGNQGWQTQFCR